jgi:hypothetical protein
MILPEDVLKYNHATNLLNKKKYDKAVSEYKALLKRCEFKEAYLNLGNCYKFLDKDTLAVQCYHKANSNIPYLDPKLVGEYPLALNNLGLMNFAYGRDDEAIATYDHALEVNPNFEDASWNKATAWLRQACSGKRDFATGWDLYEARFTKNPPVQLKTDKELKVWDGRPDVSVIVLSEQGIGDNIMFYRFVSQIERDYGIKMIVQCEESLGRVFNTPTCFLTSSVAAEWAIPSGSLGRFIKGEISGAPYLPKTTALKLDTTSPNIGFVWSGSPSHANDRHRSVNVQRFKRFNKYGTLWNLNPAAKAPSWAKDCNTKNWEETVAWLSSLDAVVSVDTSIVHMAGALGIPTIMIQPYKETDFRWGDDSMGSKNIWYDSVRIVRNPQSWEIAFDTAEEYLSEIV